MTLDGKKFNENPLENAGEILYGKKRREEELQKQKRNQLLNKLGDTLTPAQILYASNENLEKMAKEQGEITGGASPVSDNEFMYNGVKLKDKITPEYYNSTSNYNTTPTVNPIQKQNEIPAVNLKQHIQQNIEQNKRLRNGEFSLENANRARKFIYGREGFSDTAYRDQAGVLTIGHGHTGLVDGKPITEDMKITKEKADELFKKDFEDHVAALNKIKTPLTENQKIALASFIYNFGAPKFERSDLYKKIEAGDMEGAAKEFDRWINCKNPKTGKFEPSNGLIIRRKKEKELFLRPDGE